jgi:hypothetical protein
VLLCRQTMFRVFPSILVLITAMAVASVRTLSKPDAVATIHPDLTTTSGTDSSAGVKKTDGLACLAGSKLLSPEANFFFQAKKFTVGRYHCLHQYGAWNHSV